MFPSMPLPLLPWRSCSSCWSPAAGRGAGGRDSRKRLSSLEGGGSSGAARREGGGGAGARAAGSSSNIVATAAATAIAVCFVAFAFFCVANLPPSASEAPLASLATFLLPSEEGRGGESSRGCCSVCIFPSASVCFFVAVFAFTFIVNPPVPSCGCLFSSSVRFFLRCCCCSGPSTLAEGAEPDEEVESEGSLLFSF